MNFLLHQSHCTTIWSSSTFYYYSMGQSSDESAPRNLSISGFNDGWGKGIRVSVEGVSGSMPWLRRGDGNPICLSLRYSDAAFDTDIFDFFFFAFCSCLLGMGRWINMCYTINDNEFEFERREIQNESVNTSVLSRVVVIWYSAVE